MYKRLLQKIKEKLPDLKVPINFLVVYTKNLIEILKKKRPLINRFFSEINTYLLKLSKINYQVNFNKLKFLRSRKLRIGFIAFSLATIILAVSWFSFINPRIFKSNVKRTTMIYIRSNSDYQQVLQILWNKNIFINLKSFDWLARQKKYPELIKSGAYKLIAGWNNNQALNVLLSGNQTPVKVTFNNIRFREALAGRLAKCLEADSVTFLSFLNDDNLASSMGFTHENFPCIFIPNTYEFYWTTPPKKFIERMKREYDLFWNENRKNKAEKLGLSVNEIMILASIIQEETNMNDEKAKIAGVYLNRLHRDWLLQADPTIKFALGDFSVKRILHAYTTIDSPYNTYKYKGLPPGPINFPEIQSIDAVLNAEKHDYLYFCAKEDFSGYHYFSSNLNEHLRYARKYQAALNKSKILR